MLAALKGQDAGNAALKVDRCRLRANTSEMRAPLQRSVRQKRPYFCGRAGYSFNEAKPLRGVLTFSVTQAVEETPGNILGELQRIRALP